MSHLQTGNESNIGNIEIKGFDWFCGSRKIKQGRERTISCCKSMMDHWAMESRKHPAHQMQSIYISDKVLLNRGRKI